MTMSTAVAWRACRATVLTYALVAAAAAVPGDTVAAESTQAPELPAWIPIPSDACRTRIEPPKDAAAPVVVAVARTTDGNTAVCAGGLDDKLLELVALAGPKTCRSAGDRPEGAGTYGSLLVGVADRSQVIVRPHRSGALSCGNAASLMRGASVTLRGLNDAPPPGDYFPVSLVDEQGVFARVASRFAGSGRVPPPLANRGSLKSGPYPHLPQVSASVTMGPADEVAEYGVLRIGKRTFPNTLVVCDTTAHRVIGTIDIVDLVGDAPAGMATAGIEGNDLRNLIRPARAATLCRPLFGGLRDDRNWYVAPPNPAWNLAQFWIVGKGGGDWIVGLPDEATRNVIYGDSMCGPEGPPHSADDFLFGGLGDDVIYGEDGNDQITGYAGNDHLHGGYVGCGIAPARDADIIMADDGNDWVYGDYWEPLPVGGADIILGGAGNDTILAGGGDDRVYADPLGWDVVRDFARGGLDRICAEDGTDWIDGGPARDDIFADAADHVEPDRGAHDFVGDRPCPFY